MFDQNPGSVSPSLWAKIKAIDAVFKTSVNQGIDQDRAVCVALQDCFDLLAKDLIDKGVYFKGILPRCEIENNLLNIAVALEWLPPAMSPNRIVWTHREWLQKLVEGRIAYVESCMLGEPFEGIDKLGYVVIAVPETDPLSQSEKALEALKSIHSQPRKRLDLETSRMRAAYIFGVPTAEVTSLQLALVNDKVMRKCGSVTLTDVPLIVQSIGKTAQDQDYLGWSLAQSTMKRASGDPRTDGADLSAESDPAEEMPTEEVESSAHLPRTGPIEDKMTTSIFWRDMEARFRSLRTEHGDTLWAKWRATPWDDNGNHWYLGGSSDPRAGDRFTILAERAAVQLGHTGGPTALFFWLDVLKGASPNFSIHAQITGQDGTVTDLGRIDCLYEASADCCLKLETEEIIRKRKEVTQALGPESCLATKPAFPVAALGRIEGIKAKARADLRRKFVSYWTRIMDNRVRQANFIPKEIIPDFRDYALAVFDAKAEEHLLITDRSPRDFVEFLRTDLISEVWSELEGDTGLWRQMVEESLTLSNFVFPHVPGRSIKKQDYLAPQGRDVIVIAMRNCVDELWVGRSWSPRAPNETSRRLESLLPPVAPGEPQTAAIDTSPQPSRLATTDDAISAVRLKAQQVVAEVPAQDKHLELLELVLIKRALTLEKWASEKHVGRTTVFDWKCLRLAGKSLTGKVSETKAAAIEKAIETDAEALGLTTRTDSD